MQTIFDNDPQPDHGNFAPPPQMAGDSLFQVSDSSPFTRGDVDPTITRWIITAATSMAPEQARAYAETPFGGIVLGHQFKTLAPSKHMLRRCQITPLVQGYDWVNEDAVAEDVNVVRFNRRELTHGDVNNPLHQKMVSRAAYPVYPGRELASLLMISSGEDDCGIRELPSLRGVEPPRMVNGRKTECRAFDLQLEIFPDWNAFLSGAKPFFPTTDALDAYLEERAIVVSDEAREIIGILRDSNRAFEAWALRINDGMARLVQAPITENGRRYAFGPLHNYYFDLLNLNREAFLTKRTDTPQSGAAPAAAGVTHAELAAIVDKFTGALAQVASVAAPQPAAAPAAESPVAASTSELPAGAVCAALNGKGEPCKGRVVKELNGAFYCSAHP